ncbi:unnamed protein product [Heterosigma akashiwo]|mmetsp:Transcript_13399/g.18575  ORF Transcript_13399/g.18575 Transcript_13399/m.18575 type:complete len:115 (+) Transcript_13399:64-408(+)|eukprot:CAMPEP_0194574644 /NCGR_PEP_ID=MMETSP0292-20121207/10415_1 /TAXON_ID=39354 /ORGANISM="Heterosigma akashiwo, Strain CCMP2393" /LENGTH=114 /DNA_ID=CAMNT_0039426211 /DNA_START=83 /DNA_END=427 /DNA_ORIENTATION=+
MSSQGATSLGAVFKGLIEDYKNTPIRLKLIDAYLLFVALVGGIQVLYCLLVGSFPFNSFLSGFFCALGAFCFGVSLRLQVGGSGDFKGTSPEKAFAEFVFCNMVLFLAAVNFMG